MESKEHELDLLEHIAKSAEAVHQRDLARIAGLSLGMTNAVVKRLVQKGWLTIRKVNNRNIRYAVSPAGIDQIMRRSYLYFKRTIKNIACYREAIEEFIDSLRSRGFRGLILVGPSDLDFIVEHACSLSGIEYTKDDRESNAAARGDGLLFMLYSESYTGNRARNHPRDSAAFLQDVVSEHLVATEGAFRMRVTDSEGRLP